MVAKSSADPPIQVLSRKDFVADEEVRWCPGCGDYSILAQTQRLMPELGLPRENIVFISGIGCSRRLPHYMNTYGFPRNPRPPPPNPGGDLRPPLTGRRPASHGRGPPPRLRTQGRLLRRDLPELQHLQRRRLRGFHR